MEVCTIRFYREISVDNIISSALTHVGVRKPYCEVLLAHVFNCLLAFVFVLIQVEKKSELGDVILSVQHSRWHNALGFTVCQLLRSSPKN